MAAVEITNVIPSSTQEQEDAWLYGDTKDPSQSTLDANATEFVSKVQNGNNNSNNNRDSDDETDSDDDDDVQITIREISKSAPGPFGLGPYQPPQITPITAPKTVSVITAPPPTITTSQPLMVTSKRTIDVNAVGNINGVPIYDYDIDTMCEEKPWRIPGADMTDYFNYGFNEESWKAYCDKQKGVRQIATDKNKELGTTVVQRVIVPPPDSRPLPELPKLPRVGGTIDVLGSKKDSGVPHPISSMAMQGMPQPRPVMLPHGALMFPHVLPQSTFLPPPTLAPPGLAPPPELRPDHIKQENGHKLHMPSGPLPPPGMFPPPGMPSMLPPPGSMVPPLLLPPPFSDDSGASSDDEDRRRRRRSHSRERKRSRERRSRDHSERRDEHRRSRRSPRKEKKSRKSSRGDETRHRHRRGEEDRSKRSRRKKDEENDENLENGVEETEQ